MTLLTQVVSLRWEEGGEQHRAGGVAHSSETAAADWTGRLWKEAFDADLVEIVRIGEHPALLKNGEWKGFTMGTFQPGSTILVTVYPQSTR